MPNKMTVDRDKNGRLFYLYQRGVEDAPTLGKENLVYLDSSDVLHIPGLGFDGLAGYSPIAMAKNAIGLAMATEEYGAKFFANRAAPGGVLEHQRLYDHIRRYYPGFLGKPKSMTAFQLSFTFCGFQCTSGGTGWVGI